MSSSRVFDLKKKISPKTFGPHCVSITTQTWLLVPVLKNYYHKVSYLSQKSSLCTISRLVLVSSNKLPNTNLHHWNEESKCMQNGWCYSAFLRNWPIRVYNVTFVSELWNKNIQFITSAPSSKFMLLWNLRAHHKFIHSFTGMCRMWRFLAVLRSFFHSSMLHTFSCRPSPPTILPSSLTSSCHLFLGLPLNLVVPKFTYNTLLGIIFSSILCTCPNQCNLFNLVVYIIVGFLTLA